jgi:hypothetical protein
MTMFFEKLGGRKNVYCLFGALLLFGGLAIGKVDGVAFTGGLVALAGVLVEGNVRSKKILNGIGGKKK